MAVVLTPSWPLPPFVAKSPLVTNSVTANADELVSNNNKAVAVPVRSDLVGTDRNRRELNVE
jgi:hypothetical protein